MLENMEKPEWLELENGDLLGEISEVLGFNHEEWKLVNDVEIKGHSQVTHLFETALQSIKDGRLIPILYLSRLDEDKSKKIMLHRVKSTDTMIPGGLVVTDYDLEAKEQALCEICNMRIYRINSHVIPSAVARTKNVTLNLSDDTTDMAHENLNARKKSRVQRRNRDRTKIVMDILSNVQFLRGASITQLIYKCNLNYKSAKTILSDLISRELLRVVMYDEQIRKYELTERGRTALERLRITEAL